MFRKISLLAALLALLVIVLGAYVRLTDAGLGCLDWPGCYGKAVITVVPVVASLHLLLGFVPLWVLSWSWLRLTPNAVKRSVPVGPVWLVVLGMALLLLQIALGGWVSSNYAALACSDFPRCNGLWLPDADFGGAFNFLPGLLADDASTLPAAAKLAVHWLHRVGGLLSFVLLSLVMMSATNGENPKPMRRAGVLLSLLLLLQIWLGIYTLKHDLPLWSAVAHNGIAALMMLPLLAIYFYSRYALPESLAAELGLEPGTAAEFAPLADLKQAPEAGTAAEPVSLFLRLKSQLQKTRGSLGGVLAALSLGQKPGQDLLEEVEASLIMADLGMETTTDIIRHLTETLEREQLQDGAALSQALKQNLFDMLQPCSQPLVIPQQDGPFVILVVGVNGAGKTTSIGKLAHRLQAQGHSVMLAAGDTFRAAAVEQLQTWGERNNVQVVAQHSGADSASVIYDALQSAKAKNIDVLIADTAGRLHTKSNLMDELTKIKRIMARLDPAAPHEVLLILDAGTGQNALSQAKLFNEAVNLTGLALTKLDGTAKGGVIFALANQLRIPIRFIGVGEGIADLQDFEARSFVDALFAKD
jgi:fused signal recognition particle receptor